MPQRELLLCYPYAQPFEGAFVLAAVAAGAPLMELWAPSALPDLTHKLLITKLEIITTTAVASTFGLWRSGQPPFTAGLAPFGAERQLYSPNNAQGYANPSGLSPGKIRTVSWGTAPVKDTNANLLKGMWLPAVAGSKQTWEWPEDDPLVVNYENAFASDGMSVTIFNDGAGASAAVIVNVRAKSVGYANPGF